MTLNVKEVNVTLYVRKVKVTKMKSAIKAFVDDISLVL